MELPSTNKNVVKAVDRNDAVKNEIADDPLSVTTDPLSSSLASDPLTAALIDPLATVPTNSPSGIFDVTKVIIIY